MRINSNYWVAVLGYITTNQEAIAFWSPEKNPPQGERYSPMPHYIIEGRSRKLT